MTIALRFGRLRTKEQKRGTKYFAGTGKAPACPGREKAKAGKRAGKRAKKK